LGGQNILINLWVSFIMIIAILGMKLKKIVGDLFSAYPALPGGSRH
jgi:hypothetical protein